MRCSSEGSTYYVLENKKQKFNFRVQFSPNESRKWVSSCSNRPGMKQQLHACLSVYPLCVDKARRSCLPGYKVQAPLSQGCLKWEPHQQPEACVGETVWEAVYCTRLSTLVCVCCLPPIFYTSHERRTAKAIGLLQGEDTVRCLFYFLTLSASLTAPHSRVTFPKVLPSGRERQSFSSWYSLRRPHASQGIISCVRFRKAAGFTVWPLLL